MSLPETERLSLLSRIYDINEKDFETVAIAAWRYQYAHNELYQTYCNLLGFSPLNVRSPSQIPFLPISMFKEHVIKTANWEIPDAIFRSSGTTGMQRSTHHVRDINWYHAIAESGFNQAFGKVENYVWLSLLPSYHERNDSSLIEMVHHFMSKDSTGESHFFKSNYDELIDKLSYLKKQNRKAILIGVTFALLDFFENNNVPSWDELTVIETGGMKGRGVEITREELHLRLSHQNDSLRIASEYGMTELLSQAYLMQDHFIPAATMKVLIRDISDPLTILRTNQRGAINVIDLANIDTCCFVATEDVGTVYEDGSFNVLGRLDQSDVRGCNLLFA